MISGGIFHRLLPWSLIHTPLTHIPMPFYFTDRLALDLVAPIPVALWATLCLVSANSPKQCPIISSCTARGTNVFPLCTFIVSPIISGSIIMSLQWVSMFFWLDLIFLSRIFSWSVNPFFIFLLHFDGNRAASSLMLSFFSSSTLFPL